MTCEAVLRHVFRGCPTNVQFETGLRTSLAIEESLKLQVIVDNTCKMGYCIVVLKDQCTLMWTGVGHSDRLNNVSVVEPSDTPLADVEFCPPSQGDSPQTMTLPLCSDRVRSLLEAGDAPQFDAKPFAAHHENREQISTRLRTNARPLCERPPLTNSTPCASCLVMLGIQWQRNVRTKSRHLRNL